MLEPENKQKKDFLFFGGLIIAAVTIIPASLHFFRLASVYNMQSVMESKGQNGSSGTIYDTICFTDN